LERIHRMDTTRVDICYRPLRIAWAIGSDDIVAFREAVRLTHTMWGGRFNPIVLVDRAEEARQTIEAFRADFIVPVGAAEEVQTFPSQFPHLINPLRPNDLFLKYPGQATRAHVLDMHNALVHSRDTPAWKSLIGDGTIHIPRWAADDPLADAFLAQWGDYPDPTASGIDYDDMLRQVCLPILTEINRDHPLPADLLSVATLNGLSRHGFYRHYSISPGWDQSGVFVGDATRIEDLVAFWNLRAADIRLLFVDPNHWGRYDQLLPAYTQSVTESLAHLPDHLRNFAVWTQEARTEEAIRLFGGQNLTVCRIGLPGQGLGGAHPPMMTLGEESSLGVYGSDGGRPRASFALHAKPFNDDHWFYTQHLVASVALLGGDEQHTFRPPYVPEWNEFYSRTMYFQYDRLRIEPERIGIVIDAVDHDAHLTALPASDLIEKLFDSAGLTAAPSDGGLIARQLIARVGGVQGGRVFKIPGVRRLLKMHGPTARFTMGTALQLIGGSDPKNPDARFTNHQDLFIEPRDHKSDLTPRMVFEYLVEKGLFRIGADLKCPTCRLTSWVALDALKQVHSCELCGATFEATRQLVGGEYRYRRSGVLGLQRDAQGAVPVALVLQQLDTALNDIGRPAYGASYNLCPKVGVNLPVCEVDFAMVIPSPRHPEKADVLLGECKDQGGIIDAADIDHLRQVADALPAHRLNIYIVFAKLAPFTAQEIELVRTLNGRYQRRAIMLTARELEPYDIYERTKKELGIRSYGNSAAELASVTERIYFTMPREAAE
jgi:hypothetical protein